MPDRLPGLCRLATRPLQWLPPRLHAGGLAIVLNHLLAHALANGDMAFLRGKSVAIEVADLRLRFHLACDGSEFSSARPGVSLDVVILGDVHTFLLLATQREDADALFLQRRLRIEGDAAIGLHLKNFLAALGDSPLPTPARLALTRLTGVYERRCLPDPATPDPQTAA